MRSPLFALPVFACLLGCADVIGADFDVESETVASGLSYPKALVVGGGYIYATLSGASDTDGKIMRFALDGSGSQTIADGQNGPDQLVLDGGYVYWTQRGGYQSVRRARVDGSGGVQAVVTELTGGVGIVVQDGRGYFTSAGGVRSFDTQTIGGASTVLASGLSAPALVATDGKDLFVTEYGMNGGVARLPLAGGNVAHVVTGLAQTAGLAVRGGACYYGGAHPDGRGLVGALRTSDDANELLVDGTGVPAQVLADDAFVYWASFGDGRILKIALAGGNAIEIAKNQVSPNGLAIDDTFVYWAELSASGAIKRRKK